MTLNKTKNKKKLNFDQLYKDHFQNLCVFLLNFTPDKEFIKDIVQDTFIRIWSNEDHISIKTTQKGYLYKSVYNNFINHKKSTNRRNSMLESYYLTAVTSFANTDEEYKMVKIKKLQDCISKLPPKCREIFISCKISGLKYKEAATTFGVSLKTVEGHITKAFTLLKNCIN